MKLKTLQILFWMICTPLIGSWHLWQPDILHAGSQEVRSKVGMKIDINQAKTEELIPLKGIGPVIAERIVHYRQENGPFHSPNALLGVKGIGPKKLESIKKHIRI